MKKGYGTPFSSARAGAFLSCAVYEGKTEMVEQEVPWESFRVVTGCLTGAAQRVRKICTQ